MTVEQAQAVERYRAARDAYYAAVDREDAAFGRYFSKLQAGTPTNGAAVQRLSNLANYASADMFSAQGKLWNLDLDPHDIDDADGVERSPICMS